MKISIFVQIDIFVTPVLSDKTDLYIIGRERLRVRDLKFFRVFSKNKKDTPERFFLLFFTKKVSTFILIERGSSLSQSQNDKSSNI